MTNTTKAMKLIDTNNSQVYAGTCGGALLSIFSNVFVEDLVRTVILAFVGAVVSFFVSLALKKIVKKNQEPRTKNQEPRTKSQDFQHKDSKTQKNY